MRRFALVGMSALLAMCLAVASAIPAQPAFGARAGAEAVASSRVIVRVEGLRVVGVTDDIAASLAQIAAEPDKYVLRAQAAGAQGACSFAWTRTVDGVADGFSHEGAACRLADHLSLLEQGRAYVYTVEVRDEAGAVARASVRVAVVDGYADRTLSAAGLTVAGSMHVSASLDARPLSSKDPAFAALAEAAGEADVVCAWRADLAGAPDGLAPYVGTLEVSAAVPNASEGEQAVVARRSASGAVSVSQAAVHAGAVTFYAASLGELAVALPRGSDPASPGSFVTVTVDVRASAEAGRGGTVSPSGTFLVSAGSSQTFYAYPDEGYDLDAVYVDGIEVQARPVAETGPLPAAQAVSAGGAGLRAPETHVEAAYALAPLATVEKDGSASAAAKVGEHGAYWFTVDDFRDDTVVEVLFKKLAAGEEPGSDPVTVHEVRASARGGGRVSPERAVVPEGGSATFALVPGEGSRLERLTLDGTDVTARAAGGRFTVESVRADAVLEALFVVDGGPGGGGGGGEEGGAHSALAGGSRNPSAAGDGPWLVRAGDGAVGRLPALALAALSALAAALFALEGARAARSGERRRARSPKRGSWTRGRRLR